MDLFFNIFPVLFLVVFVFVIGMFISVFAGSAKENRKNNNSPRLSCQAEVVAKRTHVRGDHAHTTYFATFQFPSGDRLELNIPHSQFGYLVEGDKGTLTFQGTRFLGFERT